MSCPRFTYRRIVDQVPAVNITQRTRKAFCLGSDDAKQELVSSRDTRCLRLPSMMRHSGVLAWTTSTMMSSEPPYMFRIEQVSVVNIFIAKIYEGDHKQFHHTETVIADFNVYALQWHPRSWTRGDLYQACITNSRVEDVALNVALIGTWNP